MKKTVFSLLLVLSIASFAFGQNTMFEKKFYAYVDTLEKGNPVGYYLNLTELFNKNKNEASFIFLLGLLRCTYYVGAKPEYLESIGYFCADYNNVQGTQIRLYLRSDIDNYIKILDEVISWGLTHDYTFFPKKKHTKVYDEQLKKLKNQRDKIISNREQYIIDWKKEKEEYVLHRAQADSAWQSMPDSLK